MFRFDQSFREEFRSNGAYLAIAFVALTFGFAAPAFSLPFIYPEVIKEFGWTREQATLLASAKYLTGAVACVAFGRIMDVSNAWTGLIVSIVIGGLALGGFLLVHDLTSYYVMGVLLGIAGPGAMVSTFVLVARTFKESQGTATGIALVGSGLGGTVMPLLTAWSIGELGWRTGMAVLSIPIWTIALPLLLWGRAKRPLPSPLKGSGDAKGPGAVRYVASLMRGREFWLMAIAFYVVTVVDQGFTQHQVLMFNDAGLSREMGAVGISAMGAIAIAGRLMAGNVLDKSSTNGLAGLYMLLAASALLALFLGNPMIFIAFVVVRALAHATVMVDGPVIARHTYGTVHLGVILGLFTAMANLGSATGPWLMARMFDATGDYRQALILFMILPVASAVLIWFVRPREWLSRQPRPLGRPAAA